MSARILSKIFALFACCAFSGGVQAASAGILAKFDELPAPTVINQFYECLLVVTDADGAGMAGLRLQIRGRMPEHAHGLPTVPRIFEEGGGRYRIKGLSFNMPGRWVVEILHDDKPVLRQEFSVRL
ncbi:MAG: FixH family protein [Azoarcus sp.]|nr:FixH family protein [Azoarcus sp.]